MIMSLGRRMISNDVIMEPEFIKGGAEARSLYMYLVISADDIGIVPYPSILSIFNMTEDSEPFQYLVKNKYIITVPGFEYVAITHWHLMNTFKGDRNYLSTRMEFRKRLVRDRYTGLYRVRERGEAAYKMEEDLPKSTRRKTTRKTALQSGDSE